MGNFTKIQNKSNTNSKISIKKAIAILDAYIKEPNNPNTKYGFSVMAQNDDGGFSWLYVADFEIDPGNNTAQETAQTNLPSLETVGTKPFSDTETNGGGITTVTPIVTGSDEGIPKLF